MSKNRLLPAIFAVLVLLGLVGGGSLAACSGIVAGVHQCAMGAECASPAGAQVSGVASETSMSRGHECTCPHVPASEADVAGQAPGSQTLTVLEPFDPSLPALKAGGGSRGHRTAESVGLSSGGAPPFFLLDCALLI